ncbi:MAG: tetratricopeptide repeat protein [Chthoniobacterales bacterium]
MRGDSIGFQEKLKVARSKQQEMVRQQPDYSAPLCSLAIIDAMLGRKDDALREGQRALDITPVSRDALSGTELRVFFAVACAWVGEKDQALEQLDAMTQTPRFLSYGQLKLQPYWDPLRGDPRFEKIVASLAPKEMQ